MCATHNVGKSSMAVIQKELELGARLTDEILLGRRPWKDLFAKHTFFTSDFRYYLTVISASKTKEAQNTWAGFIESRVRILVQKIETHPSIGLARAFNKGYERVHRCKNDADIEAVQSGSLDFVLKETSQAENGTEKSDVKSGVKLEMKTGVKVEAEAEPRLVQVKDEQTGEARLDTNPSAPSGADIKNEGGEMKIKLEDVSEESSETTIYTTNHYIGLQLAEGAKSLDLSREVNDWKAMCLSNALFNAHVNSLTIQQVRNFMLPDDVFEEGEVKPVKMVKKKRVAEEPAANPAVKRQQTAAATA